jgi:hypothetical protein
MRSRGFAPARCRACGEPIEFVRTGAGSSMPLDLGRSDEGDVLVSDGVATVLSGERLLAARVADAELRRRHSASCQTSERFRNHQAKKGVA